VIYFRYLLLVKWIPYSHRYDLITRSIDILNKPKRSIRLFILIFTFYTLKRLMNIQNEKTSVHSSSNPIPLIITHTEALDSVLFQLGKYFNIVSKPMFIIIIFYFCFTFLIFLIKGIYLTSHLLFKLQNFLHRFLRMFLFIIWL
jgi:energy-converting hydrogenase Eha subunit F